MSIITFFEEAANNLAPEKRATLLREFAEILKIDIDTPSEQTLEKLADQDELISLHQQEIGRLNRLLVSHADGVDNASMAALDVLGERARQRRLEGYDDQHDDNLDDWSLLLAAMSYIEDAHLRVNSGGKGYDETVPATWPFGRENWKPKAIRKSLVAACALIIAEIEVLDRAEKRLKDEGQAAAE